ncbi:hypothetical protein SAMN04489761_2381 [Tenacibaculum sp. MAR_2009_124]|uniref:hypothetical protein n=1 Tax=Tenacibaculum sp. MAR_2009_124 TaxID=1250059 RepID=UPI00089CCB51|nr:hypothetical protein [Tenacibaculum sp. MAR_2009_124]SEC20927.1 hypothetical protein SAMN04489761_2381 [Tenacibaculum sp. MAR_2009_124]
MLNQDTGDKMNYLNEFTNVQKRLHEIGANILYAETEAILTDGELPYLEEEYGVKIIDEVFQFYNTLNGAELEWSLTLKETKIHGYMSLQSFIGILDEETEGKLWVDWYHKDDVEEIKQHYIFEFIPGADYYITIKFDKKGGYKLYYVAEGAVNNGGSKNLPEIPLTISQYFKVVSTYLGFSNIRYHLHKKEFYEKPFEVLPELEIIKELIPDFQPPLIRI